MDDIISRQAAINAIVNSPSEVQNKNIPLVNQYDGATFRQIEILGILETLPSAERRGRWEFNIDDKGWSWDYPYMCDQCGEWAEKEFNFCPKCGARMEE